MEAKHLAILKKQRKIQEEKEENLRIEKYNKEKAMKEEQLFQEKKKIRTRKRNGITKNERKTRKSTR